MASSQFEVMLALSEMKGQLSAFIEMMQSQGVALASLTTEQAAMRDRLVKVETTQAETVGLRDRVVAIESSTLARAKATPPWWVWVAVVVPTVAFVLSLAKDLYGGG